MVYYFSKTIQDSFENTVQKVKAGLTQEGFGVLTEIDVQATLKNKLNKEFRNYIILGACNPPFAFKALQSERMIGTMLPCNVIVQEGKNGGTEIAAIDPAASMQAVENESLAKIALEVRDKLRRVVEQL